MPPDLGSTDVKDRIVGMGSVVAVMVVAMHVVAAKIVSSTMSNSALHF